MTLRDVSSRLDQHLASMTGLPPVAWPNVQFNPPVDTLYISVANVPADSTMFSMSRSENVPGIYRINIYAPVNKGPAEAENMAGKLEDHFKATRDLGNGLMIENISFSTAISGDAYYMLPMSINWRVLISG